MTELDAGSLYVVRRHKDLSRVYGDAPTAVDAARQYFSHNVEAMAVRIGRAPYLLGECISSVDVLLTTCLEWAALIGLQLPRWLNDYRLRLTQRPAYQAAMKKNFPF
jgi:glutathione S-transferase